MQKINDWGERTRQGTVRNHSAAAGAVVAVVVGSGQFVDSNILHWLGEDVGNCTVLAPAVGLSRPLAESKSTVWVQHRRNLDQDPRK